MSTSSRSPRPALTRYLGRRVHAADGRALGAVADVLADARSGAVQWLVVRVVGLRPRHRAVPVELSIEIGEQLVVPTSRAALVAGPPVRPGRSLTAREEIALRDQWSGH